MLRQQADSVERDIAGADDDRTLHGGEMGRSSRLGMAVDPADEAARGLGQLFAGDAQPAVHRRAGRQRHGVIVAAQRVQRNVAPDLDAEMEPGRPLVERPPQHPGNGAGRFMVRRHAETHQAERLVQPLEHVDDGAPHGAGERIRQIAACRPRSDDCETRRQCSFTYS